MPYNEGSPRKCVATLFVTAMALTIIALLPASDVAAATHPTSVLGTVRDSAGTPVPDASVTVNMKDGETIVSTKSETTDQDGEYSVLFLETEWEVGHTIEVIATYHSKQESESQPAVDEMVQIVDVQFNFEIPDFGNEIGFLVAGGLLGLAAAAIILRKRK